MRQKLPATPTISVIVATRNRRAALEQFLNHIRRLPSTPGWELIIVDNGSSDDTSTLLASAGDALPLLAIEEPRRGKSRALNKALSYARGDLILFADDDIVPDQLWLSALSAAAVEYPDANVFGGRILVDRQSIPRWIADSQNLKTILTTEQDLGDVPQCFAPDQYPVGPNIAIRRSILDGGRYQWPVSLGPGTPVPLGDERVFLMQLSAPHSPDRLYVPGSVVWHRVVGRDLRVGSAAGRCFLGGYAAGLIGKRYGGAAIARKARITKLAWQRYRRSASNAELFCNCARALGVAVGSISPFPRIGED